MDVTLGEHAGCQRKMSTITRSKACTMRCYTRDGVDQIVFRERSSKFVTFDGLGYLCSQPAVDRPPPTQPFWQLISVQAMIQQFLHSFKSLIQLIPGVPDLMPNGFEHPDGGIFGLTSLCSTWPPLQTNPLCHAVRAHEPLNIAQNNRRYSSRL